MQNDKLLPCPFCGGEAELITNINHTSFVRCVNGCARTPSWYYEDNAIEKWNTRKPMERIVEQLEERRSVFDCRVCRHFDKGDGSECNEDCTDALIDDLFDIVKGGVDNG